MTSCSNVHKSWNTLCICIRSYLAQFFLEWKKFQTKFLRNGNTNFIFSIFFFENRGKKFCTAGQATVDNTAHAHCMLDTWGYKHTHSSCVMLIDFPLQQWLHLHSSNVTLDVNFLSWSIPIWSRIQIYDMRYNLFLQLYKTLMLFCVKASLYTPGRRIGEWKYSSTYS